MPLSPKVIQEVEEQYDQWCLWLEAGGLAMDSYLCRRPFDLMPLNRLARLINIGSTFGRLACGDPPAPDNSDSRYLADLERIYGDVNPGSSSPASSSSPFPPAILGRGA
jgi:hypothetical protein